MTETQLENLAKARMKAAELRNKMKAEKAKLPKKKTKLEQRLENLQATTVESEPEAPPVKVESVVNKPVEVPVKVESEANNVSNDGAKPKAPIKEVVKAKPESVVKPVEAPVKVEEPKVSKVVHAKPQLQAPVEKAKPQIVRDPRRGFFYIV